MSNKEEFEFFDDISERVNFQKVLINIPNLFYNNNNNIRAKGNLTKSLCHDLNREKKVRNNINIALTLSLKESLNCTEKNENIEKNFLCNNINNSNNSNDNNNINNITKDNTNNNKDNNKKNITKSLRIVNNKIALKKMTKSPNQNPKKIGQNTHELRCSFFKTNFVHIGHNKKNETEPLEPLEINKLNNINKNYKKTQLKKDNVNNANDTDENCNNIKEKSLDNKNKNKKTVKYKKIEKEIKNEENERKREEERICKENKNNDKNLVINKNKKNEVITRKRIVNKNKEYYINKSQKYIVMTEVNDEKKIVKNMENSQNKKKIVFQKKINIKKLSDSRSNTNTNIIKAIKEVITNSPNTAFDKIFNTLNKSPQSKYKTKMLKKKININLQNFGTSRNILETIIKENKDKIIKTQLNSNSELYKEFNDSEKNIKIDVNKSSDNELKILKRKKNVLTKSGFYNTINGLDKNKNILKSNTRSKEKGKKELNIFPNINNNNKVYKRNQKIEIKDSENKSSLKQRKIQKDNNKFNVTENNDNKNKNKKKDEINNPISNKISKNNNFNSKEKESKKIPKSEMEKNTDSKNKEKEKDNDNNDKEDSKEINEFDINNEMEEALKKRNNRKSRRLTLPPKKDNLSEIKEIILQKQQRIIHSDNKIEIFIDESNNENIEKENNKIHYKNKIFNFSEKENEDEQGNEQNVYKKNKDTDKNNNLHTLHENKNESEERFPLLQNNKKEGLQNLENKNNNNKDKNSVKGKDVKNKNEEKNKANQSPSKNDNNNNYIYIHKDTKNKLPYNRTEKSLDKIKKSDDNNKINNTYNNANKKQITNSSSPKQLTKSLLIKKEKKEDKIEEKDPIFIKSIKSHYALSKPGKDEIGMSKINQDSYISLTNINNIKYFNIFGVLDGHGPEGHLVSQFISKYIQVEFQTHHLIERLKNCEEIYKKLISKDYEIIKDIFTNADNALREQDIDSKNSGTTCVLVIHIGEHLICANTGDSRAILIFDEENDKDLESLRVFPLSVDNKPENPEEKERIYKMGGVVEKIMSRYGKGIGPYRVWIKNKDIPGLAMSRSIGDFIAKSVGVIPDPEIIECNLSVYAKYVVICSDGVWEFLNNEDVMDLGKPFYLKNNPRGFCKEIVDYSVKLWNQEDVVVDDITVVTIFF